MALDTGHWTLDADLLVRDSDDANEEEDEEEEEGADDEAAAEVHSSLTDEP